MVQADCSIVPVQEALHMDSLVSNSLKVFVGFSYLYLSGGWRRSRSRTGWGQNWLRTPSSWSWALKTPGEESFRCRFLKQPLGSKQIASRDKAKAIVRGKGRGGAELWPFSSRGSCFLLNLLLSLASSYLSIPALATPFLIRAGSIMKLRGKKNGTLDLTFWL